VDPLAGSGPNANPHRDFVAGRVAAPGLFARALIAFVVGSGLARSRARGNPGSEPSLRSARIAAGGLFARAVIAEGVDSTVRATSLLRPRSAQRGNSALCGTRRVPSAAVAGGCREQMISELWLLFDQKSKIIMR
jgi:hypothetical protein